MGGRPDSQRLRIRLCGLQLRNPIIAASGSCGYGVELERVLDWSKVGGLVLKGLSSQPLAGNPPPRLWETPCGMLNSVGLQNLGVRAFVKEKLPFVRQLPTIVFANVFGFRVEEYAEVIEVLEEAGGLDGYELNVSCPNTKQGGMYFSSDPALLEQVVAAARKVTRRPLIVKLSPNVADIQPLARAAESAGADAISLINTVRALAIDARTRSPRLGGGFGGLSGPAIKPIALRFVYEAALAVRIPVIGIGGISNGEDAAEFLIAGASAVEVGTALFWDPTAPVRIARQLDEFLIREGVEHVSQLVGTLRWPGQGSVQSGLACGSPGQR